MDQFDQLDVLARLDLIFESRNGSRRWIIVEMGLPTIGEKGWWECRVNLIGIDNRTRRTYGVYAMQAIWLTLRFIANSLEDLQEHGGRFLDRDGEDFSLDACFGNAMLRTRQSKTEDPSP